MYSKVLLRKSWYTSTWYKKKKKKTIVQTCDMFKDPKIFFMM